MMTIWHSRVLVTSEKLDDSGRIFVVVLDIEHSDAVHDNTAELAWHAGLAV
jgi:hypothetical protein